MAVTLQKEALVVHESLLFCFLYTTLYTQIRIQISFFQGSSSMEAALTLKSHRKTHTTQYISMDRGYSFKVDCRGMIVYLLKGQLKALRVIIS